jgi:flagellar protein FlgJ
MIISSASSAPSPVPLDLARAAGASGRPSPEDVQKAARQFEAILVRQLISPALQPLMSGSALGAVSTGSGGQGGGVYGYLLTDTLAGAITQGAGLGLSQVISRQLAPLPSATTADNPDLT